MIFNKFYYKPLPEYLGIKKSDIEGYGIFAETTLEGDLDLGATHIKMPIYEGYVRTPLGGFLNHDDEPNCHLVQIYDWDDYKVFHAFTLRAIEFGEELVLDYDR